MLVAGYGSDTSDDEVPGPRVSTKRTHKNDEVCVEPNQKKFQRLPLPGLVLENRSVELHADDPVIHSGRIRTFAHERGNWATYVYIPFDKHEGIQELISMILAAIPKDLQMQEAADLHISLTRTVILKHHWIDPFVESVKSFSSLFRKFMVLFGSLRVFCNEERTRTFIGLEIRTGYDSLKRMVDLLDRCLQEFKLPVFYEQPSFHMSLAWCVGDHEGELNQILDKLNRTLAELVDKFCDETWYIYVEALFCKTGNKFYRFFLQ